MNILEFPKDIKIIENYSFNDRSIVSLYHKEYNQYMILLFHVAEQINDVAKSQPYTTWGYPTYGVDKISSLSELKDLTTKYMQDILENTCWWETNG